jgi:hypothetical protein
MLPELCPPLGPGEVVKRWFRRLQLVLGIRKPKHSSARKIGYYFRCPYCIDHARWLYDLDETLSYVRSHNRLYHYMEGN